MRCNSARLGFCLLAVALAAVPATTVNAAEVGGPIANFTLPDMHGRDRSLAEFAGKDYLVVAFLGTECPLARLYAPRLQELSAQYADRGVAFIGIDANAQDSLTDLVSYSRLYEVSFPLLKDRDASVADQFGAERTPEVFVLDKNRKVRYRGRIDDQYGLGASSGYARSEVKERNLGSALDELLAGKEVSQPHVQALGCLIGRVQKVAPKGEVTYTKHIAKILEDHCVSCHRPGQVGPFALTDYDEVSGWGAMMKEVVSDGRMPPWSANVELGHFMNDPRLNEEETKLLNTWVDNGCPKGDLADLPPAKKWVDGWQIPKPDQVFYMPKPFKIPAEGVINYQNFTVDTGWTEDKWIQMSEAVPGNKSNVHHIIVNIQGPAPGGRRLSAAEEADLGGEPSEAPQARRRGGGGGGGRGSEGLDSQAIRGGKLTAYSPGRNATMHREGTAMYCPAGSRITFQMHYTTNGAATEDLSYVGVIFADPKTVKEVVRTSSATNGSFLIPAQADNHEVKSEYVFRTEQSLLSMTPHMHVRGKSFRYEAEYPDGTRELLLDVPHYDFNWQIQYELEHPKTMPVGTKLLCTAHFDNSVDNLANPNPNEPVRWGPQTWEEMMIGWFCTVTDRDKVTLASDVAANKAPAAKDAGDGGE